MKCNVLSRIWFTFRLSRARRFPAQRSAVLHRRSYSSEEKTDIVVIGAGAGGYVAAIKAAQLGMKTVCVERNLQLGGTCLNDGCIPAKSLLFNSYYYDMLVSNNLAKRGINISGAKLNLTNLMEAKLRTVKELASDIETLFKNNRVTLIRGHGKITGCNEVTVLQDGCEPKIIKTQYTVIATGSETNPYPGIAYDEKCIVSSTGALSLREVPTRLIVIGAGIIGLELGTVWNRLGAKVTVIGLRSSLRGTEIDGDVARTFYKVLVKQGIQFKLGYKVLGIKKKNGIVNVEIESGKEPGKRECLEGDVLLMSIGRRPYTHNLGLEELGIVRDKRGRISVNSCFQTAVPNIFAIGDCIQGPMLAHKAGNDGLVCVEGIAGNPTRIDYDSIPAVIYTYPEISWIGRTEEYLKKNKIKYKVGKFPFAKSRARAASVDAFDDYGFVKVLSDEESGKLLGTHILGPLAGELIAEACVAIEFGATCEDISRVSHGYMTLSKAFREANLEAYVGKSIHSFQSPEPVHKL